MKRFAWVFCLICAALLAAHTARAEEITAHGHFAQVHLYRPTGPTRQFVLYLSGRDGWTAGQGEQAARLAEHGAMVAEIDMTRFEGKFTADQVAFGDLENLARYVQGYARLDTYHTPILAAAPSTLALARTQKAKGSPDLFAGLIEAGDTRKLMASYDALAAANLPELPPPPRTLNDLPLIEEAPANPGGPGADTVAIFLSGDGGWAGLDRKVAAALETQGVAVVGLDSLRYFWSRRTPDGLAHDLDRMVRYYAPHFRRSRVLLIGYSQGASVLPAAYNRLADSTRRRVSQLVLISAEQKAAWQFHLSNWVSKPGDAVPVLPDAVKLNAATTLCLYGAGDGGALCPTLPAGAVTVEQMPGGHHFDGAYDQLARRILARLDALPKAPL